MYSNNTLTIILTHSNMYSVVLFSYDAKNDYSYTFDKVYFDPNYVDFRDLKETDILAYLKNPNSNPSFGSCNNNSRHYFYNN